MYTVNHNAIIVQSTIDTTPLPAPCNELSITVTVILCCFLVNVSIIMTLSDLQDLVDKVQWHCMSSSAPPRLYLRHKGEYGERAGRVPGHWLAAVLFPWPFHSVRRSQPCTMERGERIHNNIIIKSQETPPRLEGVEKDGEIIIVFPNNYRPPVWWDSSH